jgi:hypothetical protein
MAKGIASRKREMAKARKAKAPGLLAAKHSHIYRPLHGRFGSPYGRYISGKCCSRLVNAGDLVRGQGRMGGMGPMGCRRRGRGWFVRFGTKSGPEAYPTGDGWCASGRKAVPKHTGSWASYGLSWRRLTPPEQVRRSDGASDGKPRRSASMKSLDPTVLAGIVTRTSRCGS